MRTLLQLVILTHLLTIRNSSTTNNELVIIICHTISLFLALIIYAASTFSAQHNLTSEHDCYFAFHLPATIRYLPIAGNSLQHASSIIQC